VWLYAAWYGVILAVVSLDAVLPATRVRQPWLRAFGAGVGIAACLAGSVLLIYLALYLSWTSVGAALVAGVQGRYFIPLLLFIPLALPWRTRANARLESLAMLIPLALAVVDSAVLPSLILARYYVQ
jgi:uncharacterized membrane protein